MQSLPVDPIVAELVRGRGLHRFAANYEQRQCRILLRQSAAVEFRQMVDRFVRESQEVVKEPELDDQQEGTNQSRMLILGPVGMGKSHNMLVDVSFRRAAVDVNRVIYIPHCHA